MICFLLKRAPSKAKTDIDRLMQEMNFKNIGFSYPSKKNKIRDFFITFASILKATFTFQEGDTLILQYNLRKYYTYLCNLTHRKNGKVITMVHDLSSFYRSHISPEKEVARLHHSDYIIVHNVFMKQWLQDKGYKKPIGIIEIFDYLSETKSQEKVSIQKPYKVLYAGTLSPKKNKFLYDLEEYIDSFRFILYGSGFDEDSIRKKDCFVYKGFVPSDQLIASAEGDFGLVWDGNSIEECIGARGSYIRYNNPHKFSLYQRCGLPVIIWDLAAMAKFVKDYQVGICISSLTQLDKVLSELTVEEYERMRHNVARIGERLAEGYYFKRALKEALTVLSCEEELV